MSAIFNIGVKRNKEFERLCRMSQKALKKHLADVLGTEAIIGDGYIYYEGHFPVLLTAHMDTVHQHLPGKIIYEKTKDGKTAVSAPNGIGGDDRCGIYMILQILKRLDCSVLFCEDEEVGSIGAGKFVDSELCKVLKAENKFKYIIELDRKNANDAVFYQDENFDFHDFVTKEFWKINWGTWSDICELSPALGISSVNLSCGYYQQHTKLEYVVLEEMENAIEQTIALLQRTDLAAEPFKFVKKKQQTYYYGGCGYNYYSNNKSSYIYDYGDDDYWDSVYQSNQPKKLANPITDRMYLEVLLADKERFGSEYLMSEGKTEDECWKNIFFENPDLCANDIIDWFVY